MPAWMPVFGGKSVLEAAIILLITAVSIFLSFATSGTTAGSLAAFLGAAAVLFGLRNNVLTLLFSISFERALLFHKVAAVMMLPMALAHTVDLFELEDEGITGLILIGAIAVMILSYLVKNYIFELFYYVHIILFLLIIAMSFIHGATVLGIAGIIWGVDLLIRYVVTINKVRARLTLLPAGVVKITFDRRFIYSSGQYCFLMIPELSLLQFHPFTISSAPHELEISLHVRSLGDWTRQLYSLVEAKVKTASQPSNQENGELGSVHMDVYVEGPFGSLSVDIDNADTYKVLLLVAGGIGVTPTQSAFNHLIHQHCSKHRSVRKCVFIWSVKDRAMVDTISPNAALVTGRADCDLPPPLPMSFQPDLVTRKKSKRVVGDAGPVISHDNNNASDGQVGVELTGPAPSHLAYDQEEDQQDELAESDWDVGDDLTTPAAFHCEFYLTALRKKEDFLAAGIDAKRQPHLRFGRPKLDVVFDRVGKLCSGEGLDRVAVVVCGPSNMVGEVEDLCAVRHSNTSFDLHKEVFDF